MEPREIHKNFQKISKNLAWRPFFRFGLFYLLKSCWKSGKLDFLQKCVPKSYKNGPVDCDMFMGSIWEFWVVFEIFNPSNASWAYPSKGWNSLFWRVCWCCIGGGENYKNHPELSDTTHRSYHKQLDHFVKCFVHIFEENLIFHFFSRISEGKIAQI